MCDRNNRSVCSRGFAIHGNLPALCEHANHPKGQESKYSVYNSGGPIHPLSRNASFLVYSRPRISNNNRTVWVLESDEWMHQTLAPAIYKYSKSSFFNQPEYTMYPGQWERRFWGEENHAKLLETKKRYDLHYNFACNQCVVSVVGEHWVCSVPSKQKGGKGIPPKKHLFINKLGKIC